MISIQNVVKKFNKNIAVNNLSVKIGKKEVVGFLGPNGAGKTTTMRMITNYIEPDEGDILINGISTSQNDLAVKRLIGYLPENNPLYRDMLVCEFLDMVLKLRDVPKSDRKDALDKTVDATGISSVFYRPIGELSKGYKQRVGLAQAIIHEPEILIMDEPTEGLDPNQRVEIRQLIKNLGRDKTVLVSSHVMQEIESTCSRVLIINKGSMVADGRLEELLRKAKGNVRITAEIHGSGVAAFLRKLSGVISVQSSKTGKRTRFQITAQPKSELRPEIFALAKDNGWTLWELHQEEIGLEEIFRDLTTEKGTDVAQGQTL
jgi:ABC-2 type transport system ATP-binding protein